LSARRSDVVISYPTSLPDGKISSTITDESTSEKPQ
jgi:hypothetical protein